MKKKKYINKPSLIPIMEEGEIIATIPFNPNLNLKGVPSYLNESCNMGIARINEGEHKNKLVLMYEDEFHPTSNRGHIISENDAYELCVNRGKYSVIKKYSIQPNYVKT